MVQYILHSGKFDEILFKQLFPEFDNLQRVTPRDEPGNDIEWMTEIRNRLRGISDFYSAKYREPRAYCDFNSKT